MIIQRFDQQQNHHKKTSHKNNFAEHNYKYVNGPKTTKPSKNTQNYLYSQSQNIPQMTSNSVNF